MAKRNRPTHEFVTEHATSCGPRWSNREVLLFHCFNPHGAGAQKRHYDGRISQAIKDGHMKTGAFFVYGSLNMYHYDRLMGLLKLSRFNIKKDVLRGTVEGVLRDVQSAHNALQALAGAPVTPPASDP